MRQPDFRPDVLGLRRPEGIEKYLASGMIKGIGPIYAKKLVKAFREQVFDIIEQKPERLKEVVETVEAGLPHSHERIRIQSDRQIVIDAEPFQA